MRMPAAGLTYYTGNPPIQKGEVPRFVSMARWAVARQLRSAHQLLLMHRRAASMLSVSFDPVDKHMLAWHRGNIDALESEITGLRHIARTMKEYI